MSAPLYRNHYRCSVVIDGKPCGAEWSDEWDCMCNDRCPRCNAEIEPYESDDISNERHTANQ